MIRKRIIATLIVRDNIVVQSIGFRKYLPIGKPEIAVEFLNNWGVDEIIILDIDATRNNCLPDPDMIKKCSDKCFVPLTIGGGINSTTDAEILLQSGADKVCLNHILRKNTDLINDLAVTYGNQFVVVSIDAILTNNQYSIYDYLKKKITGADPFELARIAEHSGAGELFIQAVHNDGMYTGYDTELMEKICTQVSIPVIAGGGAKNARDMLKLFHKTKVSAASASNFFHFSEHSVTVTKSVLAKENAPVRHESYYNYTENIFDDECRLIKKDDKTLEDMRFIRIQKEII